MTMIVAWRDPFCLVADGLASGAFQDTREKLGQEIGAKKISPLSDTLAIGIAGPGDCAAEIVSRARGELQTASSWDDFEWATMDIVDEINDRSKSFRYQVSIVVAGMIGDKPGLFDSPGPLGLAITRKCAFAGTGGYVAVAAYRLALKCRPDLAGDDLLSAIVSAAISEDPATGEATYRIDLGERLQEAYLWPPPSIHTPGDR